MSEKTLGFGMASVKVEGGVCNPYDFMYERPEGFDKQFLAYTNWLKDNDREAYEDWVKREALTLERLEYKEEMEYQNGRTSRDC